ncbi:hypothetical protein JL992_06390 [Staphylococcus pseudintermedius]|nr:hypothetical protein [Staphylococcus pseudintermedius]
MDKLQIKLLSENATMPQRNHVTDAGFDIYAAETVVLEPQEKALIATDIAVNIPKGYVGLLTSRSGVSSKTHLVIETGKTPELEQVEEFTSESARGEKGFGSSGF